MKRILTILLAIFIGLSMSAQIKRSLLGFTLGETPKSEVSSVYKNAIPWDQGDPITVSDFKFADVVWDFVGFDFYDNRLSSVNFHISESATTGSSLESIWENLKGKLWNKYSDYYSAGASDSDHIVYSDSKTIITLFKEDFPENNISLMYYDSALLKQKTKVEESENN